MGVSGQASELSSTPSLSESWLPLPLRKKEAPSVNPQPQNVSLESAEPAQRGSGVRQRVRDLVHSGLGPKRDPWGQREPHPTAVRQREVGLGVESLGAPARSSQAGDAVRLDPLTERDVVTHPSADEHQVQVHHTSCLQPHVQGEVSTLGIHEEARRRSCRPRGLRRRCSWPGRRRPSCCRPDGIPVGRRRPLRMERSPILWEPIRPESWAARALGGRRKAKVTAKADSARITVAILSCTVVLPDHA